MKYTNRADLLIATGESIKMQEKEGIVPRVKVDGIIYNIAEKRFHTHNFWVYEFPLAVVEGKPVFVGDELYLGTYNITVKVSAKHNEYDGLIYSYLNSFGNAGIENFSWNPPKPKTVMVELLVEDAEMLQQYVSWCKEENRNRVNIACRKALENLK